MQEDIAFLEQLGRSGRLTDEERRRLEEYRTLLKKVLVFPAFEFTATLGFHVMGIFPPSKSIREIEHILLDLNVPVDQLDLGSSTVGATADVLTAYRRIHEGGGLAIAAHANSSNGVALRGFDFGGQTKIAYTQDPHLAALEVTDLEQRGRHSTAAFFSGTKPEYPRRMHCVQGSDAHRLRADPSNRKNLGVGDRATDVALPELSFEALQELFESDDFARTRPHRAAREEAFDFIQQARSEGPSINQDFHDSLTVRGGKLYEIIADVCAFANANGGMLYIGVSPNPQEAPLGIQNPAQAVEQLEKELGAKISPELHCTVDVQETGGKKVIRIIVPRGDDLPYAVDDNKIYLRDESETIQAVRDEIVQLVRRREAAARAAASEPAPIPDSAAPANGVVGAPRTGVEIVASEERDGRWYHTMRDLRNGSVVKNVTQKSARKLWHYAISQHEKQRIDAVALNWSGDLVLLDKAQRAGKLRYDLAQRLPDGSIRVYYGVTEDGIHGSWRKLVGLED